MLNLFLQGLDFYAVFGVAHNLAAGQAHDVSVYVLRNGSFRNEGFVQTLDETVQQVYFSGQFLGLLVNGFDAAGDIHQAQFLELFQEVVLFSVQKNEGVFGHGSNHSWEASSSSAWRFFTILEEALERFSSSSM